MKRFFSWMMAGLLLQAASAFAGVVQDWSSIQPGNAGTYADSASKVDFAFDAGPKGGEKALKITSNISASGYGGVYTNANGVDLSKFGNLKFMVKSTAPGDLQIAITDAYKVQYVAKTTIPSKDWTQVSVSLSSFSKDPYYTPPDAVTGHPIDLSKVGNLNFSPQTKGESVVLVGPVSADGSPSAAAASSSASSSAKPAAAVSAPSGPGVQVLDFGSLDAKSAGTFQDSMGSSFTFATKDNPSKKGQKYLTITYELKQGGYCGMWCRAGGNDWKGVSLGAAKTLSLMIYGKDPVSLGIALKDKNNNQYVTDLPATKGGKWETVVVNLSDFKLDPYYTPPDAKKGAPMDFSTVSNFNIQPKTAGKATVAVDNVVAK